MMALESAYQPFFTSWYSRPKRLWEVEATPEDDAISSAVSRFFCREQAKLQAQQSEELSKLTSSKRKQSDDDTEDAPVKRAKLSSDEPNERDISVEIVLGLISESDLKDVVTKVLADSVAGPILRKELLASTERSLLYARSEAKDLSQCIQSNAYKAINQVIDEAMDMEGMESSRAWPRALNEYLPQIRFLAERGPLVDGPELAWEALICVADLCITPKIGDEPKLEEGEEGCDKFHEDVDELMLYICKLQQVSGRKTWLHDIARKEEIWDLQESAEAPLEFDDGEDCRYRYQITLKFLEHIDAM